MKLTLKIKLIPAEDQYQALIETINEANNACNLISKIAWGNKTFNQFKLHHLCYNNVREKFNLSSQMVIRCISKVVDAYKLDKKKQRIFRDYGSISYDSRILSYSDDFVPIWTVSKRKKIAFVCHNPNYSLILKGKPTLCSKRINFIFSKQLNFQNKIWTMLKSLSVATSE